MDQSAIIQEQQEKISKMESSMAEMKEMMKSFFSQSASPRGPPLSETPSPRVHTLRFGTSTPYTGRIPGLETTIGAGEQSIPTSAIQSPGFEQTRVRTEIKLPDEQRGVVLDTKKTNLYFEGTEVELFIKRVEKVAVLQKAGGRDVAFQLPFIISNRKISEAIEQMEGHETGNWELLKKELIRKWGRATPLRRYKEDSIPRLIRKAQENGGINTRLEYKKFISEFEEIMDYFTRMEYQNLNPDSGNPLWKALSTELKKEVTKELAHAKQLQTTKDGRNIVPDLEKLKKYVEIALIIVDFDGDDEEYKPKEQVKKTVKIQEPATKEDLEEKLTKLTSALEYQNHQAPPHVSRPSSPGLSDNRPRYGPLECFYCKERHVVTQCEYLNQDMQDRKVYKSQGTYYYPNRQAIVLDKDSSVRELVRKFAEEQSTSSNPPPKEAVKESTSAVAEIEEWGSWVPPHVNMEEGDLQNNLGFGLRKSQRLQEKNAPSGSQPAPSNPVGTEAQPSNIQDEAPKTAPRRKSFPGSWLEDNDDEEEERIIIPTKAKTRPVPPAKEKQNRTETADKQEEIIGKLDKSLKAKFYRQSYTLTLEEILKISPNFLQSLHAVQPEEDLVERGLNSVKFNCATNTSIDNEGQDSGLTYACPVGMVDMTINKRKIRTLVDTGAEMNIIPDSLADQLGLLTTEIFMRLKGIGGHFTPIIGIAENIPVSVFPGHIHLANFFIVKGSVHTVIGRPFLADHNIRLELSSQKGEVLSFLDTDQRRLCIPICLPNAPGWHKEPPKLQQVFTFQVDEWEAKSISSKDFDLQERIEEYNKTIPLLNEDPWQVFLSEPVDWARELGAAEVDEVAWDAFHQINSAVWGTNANPERDAWSLYKEEVRLHPQFKEVFTWPTQKMSLRKLPLWLQELPGGGLGSLDFLQILTTDAAHSFLQYGTWNSRYGPVSIAIRRRLYGGGAHKWYKKHISRSYKAKNMRNASFGGYQFFI
ncbi:hypothetical protein PGTUg99_036136 [Puccinia graminis f. sp. tritici]|uniref:Peptidase A2 domain-containing protein n=1 Tax=Puccinia graminis f. sp. tritici TaxID=56615 RepID=A0A5B0RUV6_PUCGR|nr:hypothetical protein PGTUg99_036136 [Puccinia graminis f. sp. tritici]